MSRVNCVSFTLGLLTILSFLPSLTFSYTSYTDPSLLRLVSAAACIIDRPGGVPVRAAGRAETRTTNKRNPTANEDSLRDAGADMCSTKICRGAYEVKAGVRSSRSFTFYFDKKRECCTTPYMATPTTAGRAHEGQTTIDITYWGLHRPSWYDESRMGAI